MYSSDAGCFRNALIDRNRLLTVDNILTSSRSIAAALSHNLR